MAAEATAIGAAASVTGRDDAGDGSIDDDEIDQHRGYHNDDALAGELDFIFGDSDDDDDDKAMDSAFRGRRRRSWTSVGRTSPRGRMTRSRAHRGGLRRQGGRGGAGWPLGARRAGSRPLASGHPSSIRATPNGAAEAASAIVAFSAQQASTCSLSESARGARGPRALADSWAGRTVPHGVCALLPLTCK